MWNPFSQRGANFAIGAWAGGYPGCPRDIRPRPLGWVFARRGWWRFGSSARLLAPLRGGGPLLRGLPCFSRLSRGTTETRFYGSGRPVPMASAGISRLPAVGTLERWCHGPFVIEDLRPRPERSTAEVFPYRWDVESNFIYWAMESRPREGDRETPHLSRLFFREESRPPSWRRE